MKKILTLLIALVALISCSRKDLDEWTILVYMAADNNLSYYAVKDIIDMEKADTSSRINVIVQVDFNQFYYNSQTLRLKVKKNNQDFIGSEVLEIMPDTDSGDYRTLAEFVNWGMHKFPANRYSLVIWSHGTGWREKQTIRAVCPDSQSMNEISIAQGELRKAFAMFPYKPDIVVFDACNMQTVEVAGELDGLAHLMVGSSDGVPVDGFPYKTILNSWRINSSSTDIAKMIARAYFYSYLEDDKSTRYNERYQINCSVINLNLYKEFSIGLSSWLDNWVDLASDEEVKKARKICHGFNYPPNNIDIRQFFESLYEITEDLNLKEDIIAFLSILDAFFIEELSANYGDHAGTATIWFPDEKFQLQGSYSLYNMLRFSDTGWLNFLDAFFSGKGVLND